MLECALFQDTVNHVSSLVYLSLDALSRRALLRYIKFHKVALVTSLGLHMLPYSIPCTNGSVYFCTELKGVLENVQAFLVIMWMTFSGDFLGLWFIVCSSDPVLFSLIPQFLDSFYLPKNIVHDVPCNNCCSWISLSPFLGFATPQSHERFMWGIFINFFIWLMGGAAPRFGIWNAAWTVLYYNFMNFIHCMMNFWAEGTFLLGLSTPAVSWGSASSGW